MNDLLSVLNHLIAAWLAEGGGAGPHLQLREVKLEPGGFRVLARLDHPAAGGELLLRGEIESGAGAEHKIHLRIERCPERLHPALERFRKVLETARGTIQITVDGDAGRD
ncbi:MAG: hypothetical protein O7A67_10810 [SAR324 cluster bacterium]|nr:hypothetical protein [SAR324 cluster bacterium]MCZ6749693.1 hypothetical protein [SAR324 cluster bacterium]